ncbi:TlpA disulfide reductase family protein [Nonlabens agnitus]|uniref:Thioredoxin domain-containing protein n=1 Tax=Nonlabens agnitus TaxID=870484 RepID=A0A2S9WSV8_9FLAO|nr:TlpA disulfide reductase family protein [Nonlabens agnitus]PRP66571.1 hypothetical protein BST86_05385 [Nonlabens agnitus]
MRSVLPLFFLTLCLLSCQEDKGPAIITGTAPNVPNGIRVYLNEVDGNGTPMPLDTAIVMNEKFDFGLQEVQELSDQRLLTLDGANGILLFVSENQPIELELRKDSLVYSTVRAGKENEVFSEYLKMRVDQVVASQNLRQDQQEVFDKEGQEGLERLKKEYDKMQLTYKDNMINFIKQHSNKIVAPVALQSLYNEYRLEPEQIRELYNLIDKDLVDHPVMQSIDEKLVRVETVAIGKKAPYFEGKNPAGEVIKLPEVLGKVTLIDFWASWCVPCRRENPNVVEAYQKYHDKGFNIISVSLDQESDRDKWIAAIEDDQMTWNHISRLKKWQDPIAQLYNVSAIPATFLLDENGVIIEKNLRGKALHDKLEELLN